MMEFDGQEANVGTRLDVAVADAYPQYTRSSLELLFDKGMVSVNGEQAKPSHKVRYGDKIQVDETYLNKEPEPIDLPVSYKDEDVVVVDKPSGVLTHSKGALNLEPSVASFIKSKVTDDSLSGNRAGIVHRLDRGTSGIIITARNSQAMKWLQKQFSQRKVKKIYLAIVEGVPKPQEAIIDAPIGRNPKKPQTFIVTSSGKPAITEYKVLNQFKNGERSYSEVELRPLTGRTHQLRVHLAYVGHPVVGDHAYGSGKGTLLLHASSLEVTLPGGERKVFRSDIPQRFREFTSHG